MATKSEEIIDQALAVPGAQEVGETFDFDSMELPDDGIGNNVRAIFPSVKVVTGTSSSIKDYGKHGGEFYRSDTEEFCGTIDGVIIQSQFSRALFADTAAPICKSLDGIAPAADQPVWRMEAFKTKKGDVVTRPHPEPRNCGTCYFSQFVNGAAPLCSEGFLSLVDVACDPLAPELVEMRFSRTALSAFRRFIGSLKAMKFTRTSAKVGMPSYSHSVHFYTEEEAREGKAWFQLRIDKERLEPRLVADYANLAKALRSQWQDHVARAEFEDEAAPVAVDDGWGDGTQSFAAPAASADSWVDLEDE